MRKTSPSLIAWHISFGFATRADDFREFELDLNEMVIAHSDATLLEANGLPVRNAFRNVFKTIV